MPDEALFVLLDQNIPRGITRWLRELRPQWTVRHVFELEVSRATDEDIVEWALGRNAVVVTFDEDFGDQRFP